MACYHPLPAWYAKERNPSGKRGVVFNLNLGFKDRPLQVPCGKCIGCRLERSRQWAVRCLHESKLYDRNVFVTLTYEKVPPGGSLRPADFVKFMKRLRKRFGDGIRFFQCGEYGDELGRPHHHALLFNHDFPDKRFYKMAGAERLYRSPILDSLWTHGLCSLGSVTFESAGYVARYALKKVNGDGAEAHYGGRVPEYLTMSRRPGIGRAWADRFRRDFYPSDQCVVRGVPTRPPRYYDQALEAAAPSVLRRVKARRRREAELDPDNTGKRLIVREACKESQVGFLSRSYEGGR